MTAPSPLIVETLSAHRVVRIDATGVRLCSCGRPWTPTHAAQALADAGVLGPEQVRKREAAVLHALADKWQWGAWADVLTKAGSRLMDKPQAVTDWLRAQADERGPR